MHRSFQITRSFSKEKRRSLDFSFKIFCITYPFVSMSSFLTRMVTNVRQSGRKYVLYGSLGLGLLGLLSNSYSTTASPTSKSPEWEACRRYTCCDVAALRELYCTHHSTTQSNALSDIERQTQQKLKQSFMLSGCKRGRNFFRF